MNVAGFEEALTSSLLVEIEKNLLIRVASIPGLILLKLMAWADRGRQSNKDAVDLYRLLTTYADAGNVERLYDTELALLEAAEFNMNLAGAELLGRDAAAIASSPTMDCIRLLLDTESTRERLVNQMIQATYAESLPAVEQMVGRFYRGLSTA